MDVTAAEMLEQLDNELNAAGVHMAFAEMRGRLQDLTLRYGLFETLDRDHFYPTLDTAIAAVQADRGSSGGDEPAAPATTVVAMTTEAERQRDIAQQGRQDAGRS